MIVYFSATGNTRYVAQELARLLGDNALDLTPRIQARDFSPIQSDKPLVVCSPTHVSELPKFFADYLRKAVFTHTRDAYGVITNGGYSGIAGWQLEHILRKKGLRFKGYAEFKYPGIHIASITHKPISEEEVVDRIRTSAARLPDIAQTIQRGERFTNQRTRLYELAVTVPLVPAIRHFGLKTKGFWVTDACSSCGKCERLCPVLAIQMRDGKPVWTAPHCARCMACVHNCPTEAIEYGEITQGKRRYTLAKYQPS